MTRPISYHDIIAADSCANAAEAAALVRAALAAAQARGVAALPSSASIWLEPTGSVSLSPEQQGDTREAVLASAAALLCGLLGIGREDGTGHRPVPAALLLALARAQQSIGLPSLSISEFGRALEQTGGDPASLTAVYSRTARAAAGGASRPAKSGAARQGAQAVARGNSVDGAAASVLGQFRSERDLATGTRREPHAGLPGPADPFRSEQNRGDSATPVFTLAKRHYAAASIAAVLALGVYATFRTTLPHDAVRSDAVARLRVDPPAPTKGIPGVGQPPADPPPAPAPPRGALSAVHPEEAVAGEPLSGRWVMTNEVQSTSYAAYRRLRLGYRLELQQHGTRITGQGEKWLENGRRIPGATRTPITLDGVIEGRRVALTFVERGRRRTSGGTFDLMLTSNRLQGTFESDAAHARGSSIVQRVSADPAPR